MKNTGKKAKRAPELAQMARAKLINALELLENEGQSLEQLLAEEAKSNPIKIMELVSKFVPKEILADVSVDIPEKIQIQFISSEDSGN